MRANARTIALPLPFVQGTVLLIARTLRVQLAEAQTIIDRLFSHRTPTFGELWETTDGDVQRVATDAAIAVSPLDARGLRDVLRKVDPWTPVCGPCGELILSAVAGTVYETLSVGSACPFCSAGTIALTAMTLRRVNWVTGALVEPNVTEDVRSFPGKRFPLTDAGIRAWARRINPDLDRALTESGLPLYVFLAYHNLKLNRFEKWGADEAQELLADPDTFGLWQREALAARIEEARRWAAAREVTNLPRAFLTDGRARDTFGKVTIGGRAFLLGGQVARGDTSDVYYGRTDGDMPTFVIVKALAAHEDADLMRRELTNLRLLGAADVSRSELFKGTVPQLVAHGTMRRPNGSEWPAIAYRYQEGTDWSLADVMAAYPEGVDPETMVWMANRLFAIMDWFHAVGLVHGSLVPPHLVVHARDHTMNVVGWSVAVRPGQKLPGISAAYEAHYPTEALDGRVNAQTDIATAARTLLAVAGGDPTNGRAPSSLPEPIAKLLVAHARYPGNSVSGLCATAADFYRAFGATTESVYGKRRYHPFHMPRPAARS